ncbi:hypothetical protein HYH03_005716 [Edaphochlamys debaryana]|uniref:AB hydrolase-1 domain-containing protein n=1 Tax=Edaphochlamys debaryana TaxID=47281 RepID=A0A835Y516_9CHLO|nr:hypothetical protein HYH03_005716 [Edaphochlamys debaryana]|eukprot:KAG2496113.1 hypothetical protein HYH03_005716 [Edaphochlamys debaryana]
MAQKKKYINYKAPWALCAAEVTSVVLIYCLATNRSTVLHKHHFSFTRSLEDIVGITCTRAGILSLAYAIGQRLLHRPYLYASYMQVVLCLPYIVVKTILFRYGSDGVAAAAILSLAGLCSAAHVLAARRTVDWARRRYAMGLAGFGMPWEEGEDAWMILRRPDLEDMTKTSDGGGPDAVEDVPPEMLADDDSKFVELGPGLKVHYKEVVPPTVHALAGCSGGAGGPGGQASGCGAGSAAAAGFGGCDSASTGIVLVRICWEGGLGSNYAEGFRAGGCVGGGLVHGFGGGVFAWRHVMEALALQCHCRVVAFDRPAFGLTSRPRVTDQCNPYTVAAQSDLVLALCTALGLRRVVLVAHADGCLVTLRAAATSASHYQQTGLYTSPQPPPVSSAASATAGWAADHARTAPVSAEASPTLVSGTPPSPTLELYHPSASQHAVLARSTSAGSAAGSVASRGEHSSSGAAGAPDVGPVLSTPQLAGPSSGPGGGAGPSGGSGVAALEWEGGRVVISAEEVLRSGGSGFHGGSAAAVVSTSASRAAGGGGGCHGCAASTHPSGASGAASGSGGGGAASDRDLEAGPTPGPGAPVGLACMGMELDRASATSSALAPGLTSAAHHRRAQSVPGPVGMGGFCGSTRSSDGWEAPGGCPSSALPAHCLHHPVPHVLGLALLHPNLSGALGPALSRILATSHLGRSILRPLLRTEVGEVANRRAWHNTDKLTSEVLELYKTPLRVEGWDAALIETTRQRREACQGDLAAYCTAVQAVPALIVTGEHDRIVSPGKTEALAGDLPAARLALLHDCGHLSHEEAPSALLGRLVPFCGELLSRLAPPYASAGPQQAFLRG